MTGTCLDLIAGAGPTIVEGPFARNAHYIAMLHAVTQRPVMTSAAATGTSIGAALLFGHNQTAPIAGVSKAISKVGDHDDYAKRWKAIASHAHG